MFFFGHCKSAVLKKVKKISMASNVLPLHFAPSQTSSSQNSNVDNFQLDCHNPFKIPCELFQILSQQNCSGFAGKTKNQMLSTCCRIFTIIHPRFLDPQDFKYMSFYLKTDRISSKCTIVQCAKRTVGRAKSLFRENQF